MIRQHFGNGKVLVMRTVEDHAALVCFLLDEAKIDRFDLQSIRCGHQRYEVRTLGRYLFESTPSVTGAPLSPVGSRLRKYDAA
jgi:hypothetical protein